MPVIEKRTTHFRVINNVLNMYLSKQLLISQFGANKKACPSKEKAGFLSLRGKYQATISPWSTFLIVSPMVAGDFTT